MPEWKALNFRKICGSGSKPTICESTLPWKPKLNLLLRTRHWKTTMAYLLLLIRTIVPPYVSIFSSDLCHQKLLEIVHREEVKVNWILSAKVEFLNSQKGPRDRYKLSGTRHNFHTLQKGRLKKEPGI